MSKLLHLLAVVLFVLALAVLVFSSGHGDWVEGLTITGLACFVGGFLV